jgi:hypothetical protein
MSADGVPHPENIDFVTSLANWFGAFSKTDVNVKTEAMG